MASLIDPNVPITGNPTTLSVRQNFATAKTEIEALQLASGVSLPAGAVALGGGTGPLNASVIASDDGSTFRISSHAVIGNPASPAGPGALVLNANVAPPSGAAPQQTLLRVVGSDGSIPAVTVEAYGNDAFFVGRRASGTAAAPLAIGSGYGMGILSFGGYAATGWCDDRARIIVRSSEAWSDTAQGTEIVWATTTPGTTAAVERARLRLGLASCDATASSLLPDLGNGTINISAGYYINGGNIFNNPHFTGNVGIGTSAPSEALQIHGNIRLDRADLGFIPFVIGTDGNGLFFTEYSGVNPAHTPIYMATGGNVGIGTTAPQFGLDVNGGARAHSLTVGDSTTNDGTIGLYGRSTSSYVPSIDMSVGAPFTEFQIAKHTAIANTWAVKTIDAGQNIGIFTDNNASHGIFVATGGNVGISTTAPDTPLTVDGGTGASVSRFESTNASGVFAKFTAGGTVLGQFYRSVNDIAFQSWTGGASNILLNPTSGNVGIGTTTPNARLQIVGVSAAGEVVSRISAGISGVDNTTIMLQFTDVGSAFQIGAIARTGTNSVNYATTSDARLKAGIRASERGLDALMAIKVSDYLMGGTVSQGLLAQDVAKVYPEAVHEGGKDPNLQPWMIDYGRLTPLIIKAVQDLAVKVGAMSPPAKKPR